MAQPTERRQPEETARRQISVDKKGDLVFTEQRAVENYLRLRECLVRYWRSFFILGVRNRGVGLFRGKEIIFIEYENTA